MKLNSFTLTALTAGGRREADIATPTRDAVLSESTEMATAAPEGTAIRTPTHKERTSHLGVIYWLTIAKLMQTSILIIHQIILVVLIVPGEYLLGGPVTLAVELVDAAHDQAEEEADEESQEQAAELVDNSHLEELAIPDGGAKCPSSYRTLDRNFNEK